MKKHLRILAVLVGGYLMTGVVAWRVLPGRIAEAEKKRVGVTMALMKISNDQLSVSKRISEVTAQTLGVGKGKVAQVSALLEDPTLNRMALAYLGSDWATARSSFAGSVKHVRDQLRVQKKDKKKQDSLLKERIRDLEIQRKQLLNRSIPPQSSGSGGDRYAHVREQWRMAVRDIDRQLSLLRDNTKYRDELGTSAQVRDARADSNAETEAALYSLSVEYEAQNVLRLSKFMADRSVALAKEEGSGAWMKDVLSFYDFWPLNKMAKMPIGE